MFFVLTPREDKKGLSAFLHTERELVDGLIYHACNAQHHDAQRTDDKAGARVVIAAESGNRFVALVDVHCFYYLQIVVE